MFDLTYYHIQYGGIPMTEAGKTRFIIAAKNAGYSIDEINEYLKDEEE